MEMDPFFSVPEISHAADNDSNFFSSTPATGTALAPAPESGNSASVATAAMPPALVSTPTTSSRAFSLEEANEEVAMLLESGKVTMQEVSALQGMMRDHAALRDKVSKLKSLLGRSAKAQREAKMELEQTQKRLMQAEREVERLSLKVEKLANRPTHMDLLADFETNFDRALLSVPHTQPGGQDTAANAPLPTQMEPIVDTMLMQELVESRSRMEHLESLNANLQQRASLLEQQYKATQHEKEQAQHAITRLQLELRMAQMEADHASRAIQDKMASLAEMQLEIELVTKASMDANVRAKQGEEAAKSVRSDRQHVQELQMQVVALQEWALASADAKRLAMERVRLLEQQLKRFQQQQEGQDDIVNAAERKLLNKAGSIVIGAGDIGLAIIELGLEQIQSLQPNERVVLRWLFDLNVSELSIDFNLLKGKCDTPAKQGRADYLIRDRPVTGGAGGDTEAAFAVQNACTLLWSNKKSWVRPRTVKYTVDVLAVRD